MVIRFGLIPGAVDRGRCGCNHGGPTNSILGSPAGIRTRTSPPVRASVLTVRPRGSFERSRLGVALLAWWQGATPPIYPGPGVGRYCTEALALWA
jgi:hypothetical protein